MVRAWYMDSDTESDQRLEHHRQPPVFIELVELQRTTGVEYFKVRHFMIEYVNQNERINKPGTIHVFVYIKVECRDLFNGRSARWNSQGTRILVRR